jgi:hypothetical protein
MVRVYERAPAVVQQEEPATGAGERNMRWVVRIDAEGVAATRPAPAQRT